MDRSKSFWQDENAARGMSFWAALLIAKKNPRSICQADDQTDLGFKDTEAKHALIPLVKSKQ